MVIQEYNGDRNAILSIIYDFQVNDSATCHQSPTSLNKEEGRHASDWYRKLRYTMLQNIIQNILHENY